MRFEIIHQGKSSRTGQSKALDQERTLIGRSRECDLSFDPEIDKEVSGKHGELLWVAERLTYRDVGSTNGSFLNRKPVAGTVYLSTGDILRLGPSGPEVLFTMVEGTLSVEDIGATIDAGSFSQVVPGTFPKRPASRPALDRTPTHQPVAPIFIQPDGGAAKWIATGAALVALAAGAYFGSKEVLAARSEGKQPQAQAQTNQVHQIDESLPARQARAHATSDWSKLANEYAESIFLVVIQHFDANGKTLSSHTGTAFVVDASGVMATSAHVARAIDSTGPQGAQSQAVVAIQNGTSFVFDVERWAAPENYDLSSSGVPDVALLWLDLAHPTQGTVKLAPLPLADSDGVRALSVDEHLGTLGFPQESSGQSIHAIDSESRTTQEIKATFREGRITELADLQPEVDAAATQSCLMHHSITSAGTTSGSPLFNNEGRVIAVNQGGIHFDPQASKTLGLGQGITIDRLQVLIDEHLRQD